MINITVMILMYYEILIKITHNILTIMIYYKLILKKIVFSNKE